ncbi:12327_t:CDS:2 [Cetraspora pellucida]|uniref:12327_t:CDS:1 n=1 Tax=Cetraspora pellucida TaxID=1433469 RepID=A0A9N9EY10_9GLOM|nr:12327_t:CDS:2 [Cetraspora pellucida]
MQQQQQIDKMYAAGPVRNVGVATSFLYKLTELAAYTSAFASDTYHTLTSSNGKLELEIPVQTNKSYKTFGLQGQYIDEDARHFNKDTSELLDTNNVELNDNDTVQNNNVVQKSISNTVQKKNNTVQKKNNIVQKKNNIVQKNNNNVTDSQEINFGVDKKDQCSWTANDNEEEPPPPYDISWSMPTHNNETNQALSISTHNLSDVPALSSSPKNIRFETPQTDSQIDIPSTSSPTPVKRRQIRVRRPRRLLRRKSSSTDLSIQPSEYDDQDAFLSKVNEKLVDMIARGKAALNSTVSITDVDIMLAEERERETRIMKELGLQTPLNRRNRRLNGSFSDYDYFGGSISDHANYSAPESSSYYDYGYVSSNGYSTPNDYVTTPLHHSSHIHYNSPSQYSSYMSPPLHHSSHMHYNTPSQYNSYATSPPHHSSHIHYNTPSQYSSYVTPPHHHSSHVHHNTPTQYSSYYHNINQFHDENWYRGYPVRGATVD